MRQTHNYLGMTYETNNLGNGTYIALMNGVPVTGTLSQSRGESSMHMMLMLEAMQDFESKPMQVGDLLEYDGKIGMIDNLEVLRYAESDVAYECLHIREDLGGEHTNFRGPSSAYSEDQTPRCSLSGGPFITRPRVPKYEWSGIAEITFWAWKDTPRAEGGFRYQREVNMWREVSDESPE